MAEEKTYTLDDIYGILSNLENGTSQPDEKVVKRAKLPIPEEYGGGWITSSTMDECVRKLLRRFGISPEVKKEIPTFRDCGEKWFLIKMGENRSPSTTASYKRILEKRIYPFFGSKKITEIGPDDIQMYFNSIMNLSKSESVQSKAVLSGIFDRACRNCLINKNPMQFKYERSRKTGKKTVLQDDDLLSVIFNLEKLEGCDYLYACFLCFTALRRGEILGLKWNDIDFEKKTISVRRNVIFPNGENNPIVKDPKDGSFGVVYLHSELLKRIEPYKSSTGYIIRGSRCEFNGPVSRSSFTKMWNRIQKTLDLKGATSHSFRATYASMMNAHCPHIDPKALQGVLRHKTPDLAIKVYTKENVNKTRIAEQEYEEWLSSQVKQSS